MSSLGEAFKSLIRAYADIKPDEARMRLRELYEQAAELEDENRELRDEVAKLRAELQRRKDMEYRGGGFYILGRDGEEIGPICPECYEAKGFPYLLQKISGGAKCTVCGNEYAGADGLEKLSSVMIV